MEGSSQLLDSEWLAALYGRESKGLSRSIEEQHEDEHLACAAKGWRVFRVYEDKVSASPYAREKKRDDWDELLADMEARRFQVLLLWEASRGDRKASTWMQMLELAEQVGCLIYVVSDERMYDVRIESDWRVLADAGVKSEAESRTTSKRLRRHMAKAAAKGHVHGQANYGYIRVYDEKKGNFLEQKPHPKQALVVRFIIRQVSQQVPLLQIARKLNKIGVRAPEGGIWTRKTARSIATKVAYVGLRNHKGTLHKAIWSAIIDEETFWAAQRVMSAPDRDKFRPGALKYFLSYLPICTVCEGKMQYRKRVDRKSATYTCQENGCVAITAEQLEEFVTELVLERLGQPDIYKELTSRSDAEIAAARADVERQRAELEAFYDQAGDGKISAEALARVEAKRLPALKKAEAALKTMGVPPVLRPFLRPGVDVQQRWTDTELAARREIVRLLIDHIRIRKYEGKPHGRSTPLDVGRVDWDWREWSAIPAA